MQSKEGEIYEGQVTGVTNFGAFVKLSNGESGMVHISEVAPVYVKDINAFLSVGQNVIVKVLAVGEDRKISLSIKQAAMSEKSESPQNKRRNAAVKRDQAPGAAGRTQSAASGPMSFEDMMAKFKADSEEKISVLKRGADHVRSPRRGNK